MDSENEEELHRAFRMRNDRVFEESIAMIAADCLQNKMDKYKSEIATIPAKKQRGEHIKARYFLPPFIKEEGEKFYERFDESQPGFAYWCWYASVCLEFASLLPDFVWELPNGATMYMRKT